jgi:hypothetical protein
MKILIIFLLAVLIGAFPASAADSNNPNVQEKIQKIDPNVYLEIKNTTKQFINKNPQLSDNVTKLGSEFKEGNLTISQIVQKANVQSLIVDILSYESVRVEIHNMIQKPEIMDAINILREDKDIQEAASILMSNPKISDYVYTIIYGEYYRDI